MCFDGAVSRAAVAAGAEERRSGFGGQSLAGFALLSSEVNLKKVQAVPHTLRCKSHASPDAVILMRSLKRLRCGSPMPLRSLIS